MMMERSGTYYHGSIQSHSFPSGVTETSGRSYGSIIQSQSLPSSTFTIKERFKLWLKPTFKPRMVKTKGAVLVLILNFLVMSTLHFIIFSWFRDNNRFVIGVVGFCLMLPFGGWVADTYFGRFKVKYSSIWVMWTTSLLIILSTILTQLVSGYSGANDKVLAILLVVLAIGLGVYLANIIQFGMDHLNDASTVEIKTFIIWCIWTFINGEGVADFFSSCVGEQYKDFLALFVSLNLTLALVLMLLCHKFLIKEPAVQNPVRQVYNVIRYAIKNKRPRQRSAFTYCEDELPSRIDFGKSKYGGPFTTEQVEDVKTILRIVPLVVLGGILIGGVALSNTFRDRYLLSIDYSANEVCYVKKSYSHTFGYSAIALVVLHEVLVYPACHRCIPSTESLHKVLIGSVVEIVRVLVLMAFDVVSRHNFLHYKGLNATAECIFYATAAGNLEESLSPHWIALPDFLQSVSMLMIFIGAAEFLSAQVPISMKGLIIGLAYCVFLFFTSVLYVLSIPFNRRLSVWGEGIISCGFWFALMVVVLQAVVFLTLVALKKWYKMRKREDVLPNEHIFAEEVYSKSVY